MNQLIIIKNNLGEIKKFCQERGIKYEIYTSPLNYSQLHTEKIKMFTDYRVALKDKELETEKKMLEETDEKAEYDEYDQEEWAK